MESGLLKLTTKNKKAMAPIESAAKQVDKLIVESKPDFFDNLYEKLLKDVLELRKDSINKEKQRTHQQLKFA